jgi:hypothetical protein
MKFNFVIIFFCLLTIPAFGQIKFEKGYIIDNNNRKVECLIKNSDWKNNPKEFDYKLSDTDSPKKGNLTTIKEFSVPGVMKFIRVDTKIDRSPMDASALSDSINPDWSSERLFLKVLVEGKATLYFYQEDLIRRFFYTVDNSPIQQLIYKEYMTNDIDHHYKTNLKFHQQLWNDVKCTNTTMQTVERINYDRAELEKYFKKYNDCEGIAFVDYDNNKERHNFNLRITPGINYSSLSVSNQLESRKAEFKSQLNYRIGLEAEFILPFNRNSWGITIEPNFQNFKQQYNSLVNNTVEMNTLEFPVGIRRYFFINDKFKMFLDAQGTILGLNFNSKFNTQTSYYSLPVQIDKTAYSISFGGGLEYSGFNAEIRYYTTTSVLTDYLNWDSEYRRVAFIIGYNLFNKVKTNHK